MSNNERFNQLLNNCYHPRAVYAALVTLFPVAQETQIGPRSPSGSERKIEP